MMNPTDAVKAERKRRMVELLHKAASQAVQEEDPWKSCFDTSNTPAELVVRHLYDPVLQTWSTDETIVKMERAPFTHGAMRFCYRLKKRATLPNSATNHRFHKHSWSRASNYVAKAYCKNDQIDTSEEAKLAIQNDVLLQYEAQHWATKFNDCDPPSKISFLRAYAIEFPNSAGKPWFAVERFVSGTDWYGAGFVKHNTNSGFVDLELRRVTPHVFSAHSFYASDGHRLVADIQGVGDLYTDPQVLSSDYRFGDGDLGPRGMALFFKTYRNSGIADALGIPTFALSKNELKHQAKYHEDEVTASEAGIEIETEDDLLQYNDGDDDDDDDDDEELSYTSHTSTVDAFQKLDLNRMRRRVSLMRPEQQVAGRNAILQIIHDQQHHHEDVDLCDDENNNNNYDADILDNADSASMASTKTEKRSNLHYDRKDIRKSIRKSLRTSTTAAKKPSWLQRSKSDLDEVEQCLLRAQQDWQVDLVHDYHRTPDGKLRQRHLKNIQEDDADEQENGHDDAGITAGGDSTTTNNNNGDCSGPWLSGRQLRHKSMLVKTVLPPMKITEQTKINLGKVHYQLAVLHGMGRFPEVVPDDVDDDNDDDVTKPSHCSFSVLFHLSHAASLRNAPACLSLGRVHAGLGTHVSELVANPLVPLNFEAAKILLRRAMMEATGDGEQNNAHDKLATPLAPKVAAGCLLFQILQDERHSEQYLIIDEDEQEEPATEDKQAVNKGDGGLTELITAAQDTLKLFELMEKQQTEAEKVRKSLARAGMVAGTGNLLQVGDRVEGDYFMEGSYYPGTVLEVSAKVKENGEEQAMVTVLYDDDGSSETLPRDHVRLLIPPTATQTTMGGPLSDDDAFGVSGDESDDEIPIKSYELMSELASLLVEVGDKQSASLYLQEAAGQAVQDNKMKLGTEWSLRAAELLE